MSVPPLHLPTILNDMARRDIICRSSIEYTIHVFGERPKPDRRTLLKALHSKGTVHFRRFMQEWLGWPSELVAYLRELEQRTRWPGPRSKFYRTGYDVRCRIINEQHIAAVLAWIEEIKKP